MRGKEHLIFGIGTATATMAVAHNFGDSYDTSNFILLAGLGALFPDIDSPTSTIGSIPGIHFVSKILNKTIGHRTITHDPLLISIIAILTSLHFPLCIGFWFGYFTHLFLDGLTKQGLYSIILKKKIHLLPRNIKIYSESDIAKSLTMIILFIYCAGGYFIVSNI